MEPERWSQIEKRLSAAIVLAQAGLEVEFAETVKYVQNKIDIADIVREGIFRQLGAVSRISR